MKKEKLKKFILNPWTITIGGGLVILLLTMAVDVIKAETIFSTIGNVLSAVWKGIVWFFNFDIKGWWLLIGIAVIVIGLIIYAKILDAKEKTRQDTQPEFIQYNCDNILGWNWVWTWGKNWEGKYNIENLTVICDKCQTPLMKTYGGYVEKCIRCNKRYSHTLPDEAEVKLLITDNVMKKYFQKKDD